MNFNLTEDQLILQKNGEGLYRATVIATTLEINRSIAGGWVVSR